jgi:hypothetical protein
MLGLPYIMIISVVYCSISNLSISAIGTQSKTLTFFFVLGGAEILSLQGCRMLWRLKEANEGLGRVEKFKLGTITPVNPILLESVTNGQGDSRGPSVKARTMEM